MSKIEDDYITIPKETKIKLDKTVKVFKILLNSIINDSSLIKKNLEIIISSNYFVSLNNQQIKSKILLLKLEIENYLEILKNIEVTFITLNFAVKFVEKIRNRSEEIEELLKNMLHTNSTTNNYFIDQNGKIVNNTYENLDN